MLDSKNAAKQSFIPLMRELVRTYQAFARFDARAYDHTRLTVPQADVLFTLGNTRGMTCKEIGAHTLITKGTLTGIIDRLETQELVARLPCPGDGRCTRVALTGKGQTLFEKEYPRQIVHLKNRFDRLTSDEQREIMASLQRLRSIF